MVEGGGCQVGRILAHFTCTLLNALLAEEILTCEKGRFKQRFFSIFTLHNACLTLKDVKEPRGCEVDGNFVGIVSAFCAGFLWYLI